MKAVSEQYARWVLAPRLVVKWRERIEAQHGDVSTPAASSEPVETPEASPATQPAPAPEVAQALPPPQPVANPDDDPADSAGAAEPLQVAAPNEGDYPTSDEEDPTTEAPPAEHVRALGEPTRNSILAAFARVPPQPAAPQPPSPRPWFAGPQPQPREDLSEEAVDELLAGYAVGNLPWPRRLSG